MDRTAPSQPFVLAVAGKGGVGKSTIAALLIRALNDRGHTSVLAVDADSNVNLSDRLGVEPGEPVGAIREEMREVAGSIPGGMTKQQFLELKIHKGLVETPAFDLITMGRPEGPGCYCYANSLLRDILQTLTGSYRFVVIDNEAGMEHLSRRTSHAVDDLLIISDATVPGVTTAGRISRLLKELDTRVRRRSLVINRVAGGVPPVVMERVAEEGLDLAATLPDDGRLREIEAAGRPTYGIDRDSALCRSVDELLERLLAGSGTDAGPT